MKQHRWLVLVAVGGLALGACATQTTRPPVVITAPPVVVTGTCEECPVSEPPIATETPLACEPQAFVGADRYRAYVLFLVDNAQEAANAINQLDPDRQFPLKRGGTDYVIVRADVVNEENAGTYNLVVPIDAANFDAYEDALVELDSVIHASPASVLVVTHHTPWPPHCSDTVVTAGELDGFYTKEYDPPGRHPQSPGSNPWG